TNGTAEGVDMVTLEARAYGVARHIREATGAWTIVNDVAGFIGPEVFRTGAQLERACLEDIVMARLHGLTMGLDVCATFHMGIAPRELRQITARIAERAAPAYLMAVAGNADPMLGYLTTSFRDHPQLRRQTGRQISPAMHRRLEVLGRSSGGEVRAGSALTAQLYATYMKAGGDGRSMSALDEEGGRRVREMRERGLDLGIDDPAGADARLDAIYANARAALYATVDEHVINDVARHAVHVRSAASSRDEHLSHPSAGERLRDDDALVVARMYPTRRPQVQIVISD